jgi:hypothetical protein
MDGTRQELVVERTPAMVGGDFVAAIAAMGDGRTPEDRLLTGLMSGDAIQLSTDDAAAILGMVGHMADELSELRSAERVDAVAASALVEVVDDMTDSRIDAFTIFQELDLYVHDCAEQTIGGDEYARIEAAHERAQARMNAFIAHAPTGEIPVFEETHLPVIDQALRSRIRTLATGFTDAVETGVHDDDQRLALERADAAYDALLGVYGQKPSAFRSLLECYGDTAWREANADLIPPSAQPPADAELATTGPVPRVVERHEVVVRRRSRFVAAVVAHLL